MMTMEKHIPVNMRTLFGNYIMKMDEVPGRKVSEKDREEEQKLFEMIDDYIEQA